MIDSDEQLKHWVAGESLCPDTNGQCCPDFSCCRPELLQPREVREAFMAADDEKRTGFLGMFLSAAIASYKPKAKVRVATEKSPPDN